MSQERLSMRKIREILRLKAEAQLSNRAIARACHLSNSTVGEYLRRAENAGVTWPLPADLTEEVLLQQLFPERTATSEPVRPLPDWAEVHRELRHRGVTLKLLWEEYQTQHPEGYRYTQFCELYGRWKQQVEPVLRLPRKGGEEMEVDYTGVTVPLVDPETGDIQPAEIFVATLTASAYLYAEAQRDQTLLSWLGGHVRAFEFFGGVPKLVKPDNLKAGVRHPSYYEPDLNPSYQEMAAYYGVAVLPARVRKPKDKAKVENGVQNVERWVLAPLRKQTFFTLAELNQALRPQLKALNERPMVHLEKSRRELFLELDQPALRPLPAQPYELALWKQARVHLDYHIAFEKHFYSVPHHLIHALVEVRATERMVEIFSQSQLVATHPRKRIPGRFSTNPAHMPANHRFITEWSPERLVRWGAQIGPHTAQLIQAILASRPHPEQAFRACLGLLHLARQSTPPRMETASQRALAAQLLTYAQVKAEWEALAPLASEPLAPHENIRGKTYYQ
jgi:transposase